MPIEIDYKEEIKKSQQCEVKNWDNQKMCKIKEIRYFYIQTDFFIKLGHILM